MSASSIRQDVFEFLEGEGYHSVRDVSRAEDLPSSLTDRSFLVEILTLRQAREASDANDVWYYEMEFNIKLIYRLNLSDLFTTTGTVLSEVESLLKKLLYPANQPSKSVTLDLNQVSFEALSKQPEVLIAVMEFNTLYRVARSET